MCLSLAIFFPFSSGVCVEQELISSGPSLSLPWTFTQRPTPEDFACPALEALEPASAPTTNSNCPVLDHGYRFSACHWTWCCLGSSSDPRLLLCVLSECIVPAPSCRDLCICCVWIRDLLVCGYKYTIYWCHLGTSCQHLQR